jgi:hypothetical protein
MTSGITTDGADSGERFYHLARAPLAAIGGGALIAALLIVATIGLTTLSSKASRPGSDADDLQEPGTGIAVQSEVVDAWLPPTLDELAGRRTSASLPLSDEDLRSRLKPRGKDVWYALTCRLHQANGRRNELTIIHYPLQSADEMSALRRLLELIGSEPADTLHSGSTAPRVHIIPEELLQLPPRDAVAELLKNHRN